MKKEVFANRLVNLRKKKGYTQAELAEKLNVSNKTVSRWETAEGYPDISLLKPLSELLGVTCDELLSDELNYSNVTKYDIQNFLPFAISLLGVLLFYIFQMLNVPVLLSFGIFIGILIFSFYFVIKHTNKNNFTKVTYWNMLMLYFPLATFIYDIMIGFYFINTMSSLFGGYGILYDFSTIMQEFVSTLSVNSYTALFLLPYIFAFIIVIAVTYFLARHFNQSFKVNWKLHSEKNEKKLPIKLVILTVATIGILLGFWYWKYISLINITNMYFENYPDFQQIMNIADTELKMAKFEIIIIVSIFCIIQVIIALKSKYKKIYLPCILVLFIYCILVTLFTGIEDMFYIQTPMLLSVIGAILLCIVYLLAITVINKKIKKAEEVEVQ